MGDLPSLRRKSGNLTPVMVKVRDGWGLHGRLSSSTSLPSRCIYIAPPKRRVASLTRWKLFKIITTCLIWIGLLRIYMDTLRRPEIPLLGSHLMRNRVLDPAAIDGGRQKLVIILPIDRPLHDLCKVVSSAVALGYPPPVLVNWRKNFNTDKAGIGPSHLAKVDGTLEFLDYALANGTAEADRLHDNDLVMMLDALDIWFQLPPAVLLRRYYAIVQAASERVERESGFMDASWMRQRLVASAQKPCEGPRDQVSDLHCGHLPKSTLPENVYGTLTDSPLMELRMKWKRPASLNSGSFLGPAKDMRKFFLRAEEKMKEIEEKGAEIAGDQAVFASVFGEQEKWRGELRERHAQGGDRKAERQKAGEREQWDFGLTLDYTQELFYPTGYSEHDGGFRIFDKKTELQGPPGETGHTNEAEGPLAELQNVPAELLNSSHASLFADYWTGAIPAVVHHNAWRFGLKRRRRTWWDKTWYFPHLRRLLEVRSDRQRETVPLATLPASKGGSLEVWPFGAEREDGAKKSSLIFETKKIGRDDGMRSAGWEEICKSDRAEEESAETWFEEVFRDGAGPFEETTT